MPAIAAQSINDGAGTPAAHTFSPQSVTNGSKAEFQERSASIPSGYFVLTHEVIRGATPDSADRIKIGLNMPSVATVDGSAAVVRNSSAQVILNLSKVSTLQERKDLLAYVANTLGKADVKTTVENIEPFY